jgi:uncharacterized protein
MLNHDEIINLTQEYGGDWGVNHTKRLLHLIPILADGREYNQEAVWLAAYLHDWGGYAKFAKPGVEHFDRSVEVVREFLTERVCPEDLKALVVECIQYHHGGDPSRSIESILLTDADVLDLLGVVGFARCFGLAPRSVKTGVSLVKKFRDGGIAAMTLPKTKELAAERIKETNDLLKKLDEEASGLY